MITYSFMDNAEYGADDVNAIFKRLTTQGVSLYNDSQPVIQAFNGAVSAFAAAGVEMYNSSACEVVKNIDGMYTVKSGTVFMQNGSTVTITEDEPIVPIVGKTSYVYFKTNIPANCNELVCSDTEGTGDFVPLATISTDGKITDTRKFAKTKLAPCTSNVYIEKTTSATCIKYSNTDYRNTTGKVVATVNTGWAGWRYIKVVVGRYGTNGEMTNASRNYFIDTAIHDDVYIYEQSITLKFTKRGQYADITHVSTNGQFQVTLRIDLFIV